ncbi:TetR/AcrR family transcriptional regulator [Phreatobacter aquaticus]|uniref:TetR/AcrR family transcriptional regulator n=1 Tax=Phreatobacter aquaticus TaxID=2570229 RepID=A0A4D7QIX6_9HYPH|nr:TetR/AcrR family transcriptional regulator [Phreatobacter aquaticus]QCK86601.1 TetR/AcrR family transcriptional regulator [Phreatobacter aquaticus]
MSDDSNLTPDAARRGRKPSEEKREALIASALALFAERGVDGTATREIAARALTTERTLFKHFGSKQGLVQAVVETVSFEMMQQAAYARMREPVLFTRQAFAEWHRAFLIDRIAAARAAPDTYRVLLQELLRDRAFGTRYGARWRETVFAPLVGHLAAMQAAGMIGPGQSAEALAGAFFSLNLGYLVSRFALGADPFGAAWADDRDVQAIVTLFQATCG